MRSRWMGAHRRSVIDLDPGTAETVTLAVPGGGTATDTVVVTARRNSDTVLVEAGRTITLETPTTPELDFSLCRGRSHNCVDISLHLCPIEDGIGRLEVDGADPLPSSTASPATGGVELTALPATVDLAYSAYGSSAAGNWRGGLAGGAGIACRPAR
ncbi:MAG: hypothetical protein U5K37_10825 [Natrialbaceae archaeon]|nr:hypothetical protein [Natrialbaceae archaeon]